MLYKKTGLYPDISQKKYQKIKRYVNNLKNISDTTGTDKSKLKNSKSKGRKPTKTTQDLIDCCGVVW